MTVCFHETNIKVINITTESIEGRVEIKEDLPYAIFSSIKNANEEVIGMKSETSSRNDQYREFYLEFHSQNTISPLKFEFFAYPNYIYGNFEIELETE